MWTRINNENEKKGGELGKVRRRTGGVGRAAGVLVVEVWERIGCERERVHIVCGVGRWGWGEETIGGGLEMGNGERRRGTGLLRGGVKKATALSHCWWYR